MKYIITGGAGFIGSHLAASLLDTGQKVIVVDDLSTGSLENITALIGHPHFRFIEKSIEAISSWSNIIDRNDTIIHLAATVGVNNVMADPVSTLENNFHPTLSMLKVAKRAHCKLLFSSTSEVYGELKGAAFSETDPLVVPHTLCGRSAYVLGKIMSEQYCMNFYRQYGLPVIIARFFNVIGCHQTDRHGMVAPTFIRQALTGAPITLFGDGSQTRSFCDVTEVAQAIKLLLQTNAAFGETYNIGGEESVTMKELAAYIKQVTRSSSPIIYEPIPKQRSEGRDITHRRASLQKINALTGWAPRIPWQQTINNIIAYKKESIHPRLTNAAYQ